MLACLLCVNTGAALAAEPLDGTKACSLTLVCRYDKVAIGGMTLNVYRVADGSTDTGFTLSGAFASLPVSLTGLDNAGWVSAAATLAAYIQPYGIAATQSTASASDGSAAFTGLTSGLYLVVGNTLKIGDDSYSFAPFLVALPGKATTGEWQYDVTAYPKLTKTTDTTTTPSSPVDVTVLLQWADSGTTATRPDSVKIVLLRDGKTYDTYTLTSAENWRHTWYDLSGDYSWSVLQTTVLSDYTVSYQSGGHVLVITDTAAGATGSSDDTTEDTTIPQTGTIWWPVYALAVLGVLLFCIGWHRRFGERNDAA